MASIVSICQGLATNLGSITGLQVSPFMLAAPTPPSAHVFPAEVEYDRTMQHGFHRLGFVAQVFVAFTSDIGSQKLLYAFLESSGAQSIKAGLESDQTLSGSASSVHVKGHGRPTVFVFEGRPPVLGVEFQVEVLATGT